MSLKTKLANFMGLGGAIHIGTRLEIRHFVRDEQGEHSRPLPDGSMARFSEVKNDRQVVINKVVTDAYTAFLVDQHQAESALIGDFKYHDSGTGTNAEAAGDVGLQTPWGGSRDVGTQIEGSTDPIYKSVATTTYNAGFAITEHGLFNASSGATLMDRSKFTAKNVVATDQIQFTFEITFSSGG